ncbi:hypothetical protein [Rubrobacter calidifluminis]|nr:hypothetical protein [Rubrobacter calidifluminis]
MPRHLCYEMVNGRGLLAEMAPKLAGQEQPLANTLARIYMEESSPMQAGV